VLAEKFALTRQKLLNWSESGSRTHRPRRVREDPCVGRFAPRKGRVKGYEAPFRARGRAVHAA